MMDYRKPIPGFPHFFAEDTGLIWYVGERAPMGRIVRTFIGKDGRARVRIGPKSARTVHLVGDVIRSAYHTGEAPPTSSYSRRPIEDTSAHFWSKVAKATPDACWEWQGGRNRGRYGTFPVNRRNVIASRYSWELHFGPIPDGMQVCHKCDNPPCVNPNHLFLGDHLANAHDRDAKGRHKSGPPLVGELNPNAKLSNDQRREIVRRNLAGESKKSLAKEFGVARFAVQRIIACRTWHPGMPPVDPA